MKAVIVGQGYVGLPLAMRAVEMGHEVVGLDTDPERAKRLAAGESFVGDVSDTQLTAALDTGRYLPTTNAEAAANFDVAVITVPTPLREGLPDLSYIETAAHSIGPYLTHGSTVVLESTTYPGTTEELLGPILQQSSGLTAGEDFYLGYSPERIDPGNAIWNVTNTPKVVSGVNGASLGAVRAFYDSIIDTTIPVSSPKEAELTKLLENTFRHVNIALVNELAMYAHDLGIDLWEAIDAASTKPFGYMRFTPGPGVGGHCLPIDPSYLSWRVKRALGVSFRFVELANDVNEHMPNYVVERAALILNDAGMPLKGSRILVLGLSYKKNVGDVRESPSSALVNLLEQRGADVVVCDPYVEEHLVDPSIRLVDIDEDQIRSAALVIIATDHDQYDYESIVSTAKAVLDTRNRFSARHPNLYVL